MLTGEYAETLRTLKLSEDTSYDEAKKLLQEACGYTKTEAGKEFFNHNWKKLYKYSSLQLFTNSENLVKRIMGSADMLEEV